MRHLENYAHFLETLDNSFPDESWSEALKSLWYDAKGDWEASHNIAQEIHSDLGSWIHGYLHRKEGDEWNAGYWYRRANKSFSKLTLDEELKELVEYVLGQ